MKLTQWTDYALRVLMYCAASAGREAPVTIAEIAGRHAISRSHLTKIVMSLAALGYLETSRGRGGGLRLLRPAAQISVGEVVRATESDFGLVECFDATANDCRLDGRCRLKATLQQALARWFEVLDGVTLADLVAAPPPARAGARTLRVVAGLP